MQRFREQVVHSYHGRLFAFLDGITRMYAHLPQFKCGGDSGAVSMAMTVDHTSSSSVVHALSNVFRDLFFSFFRIVMQTKLLLCHQFSLPRAYE